MPSTTAQLSKRTIRGDVAAVLGDNFPLTTSSAGNGGGTTAVYASLINRPIASIQNKYFVQEGGTNDGEWRVAVAFTPSTGTVTLSRAHTAQVATSIAGHLHEYSPELYSRAINEALAETYFALFKPVLHHTFIRTPGTQRTIPLPRGMERIMRVLEDERPSDVLRDYFDRANTSGGIGSKWANSVGSGGITGENAYFPTDANGDLVLAAAQPYLQDGVIQYVPSGTLNSGATYRSIALVFRYEDSSNYLLLRLLNGVLDLRKMDAGSESSLTTASLTTSDGIAYTVRVMFQGTRIRAWVDDVEVLNYELTGVNLKYPGYRESGIGTYGQLGMRLDKGGAPATAASVRDYFAHGLVGTQERADWEADTEGKLITLGVRSPGTTPMEEQMLWLEGIAPLTTLTADTFETLVSDSTALVEVAANDPAYRILVQHAAYVVLRDAAAPAFTANPERRAEYANAAQGQLAAARMLRMQRPMKYTQRSYR